MKLVKEELKESIITRRGKWRYKKLEEDLDSDLKNTVKNMAYDDYKYGQPLDIDDYLEFKDLIQEIYPHITDDAIIQKAWDYYWDAFNDAQDALNEDIKKIKSGKWVNKGKEGTHGEFKTKKAAREQQKAMFAQGYKAKKEKLDLDESLYQTKSLTSGNKMSYELKDDGTLIVKDGDKEIFNVKVSNIEQAREQFKNMDNIETIKEDVSPEVKQDNLQDLNDSNVTTINDTSDEAPTPKDNGIAALLIDAINGEWDTIKLYNDIIVAAESYGYPDIADVIRDINKEENLHVGQLQTALETISPVTSAIDEGSIEAETQLNETTLGESYGDERYFPYNPELGWTEEDIALHKSIDWKERNYRDYEVAEDSFKGKVYAYGKDIDDKKLYTFHKFLRSNPIFPPYYAAVDFEDSSLVGPMYDGRSHKTYGVHDRYETQEMYDRLSN